MFDKRMDECQEHFNITTPEDWRQIAPEQVRARPDCGPVFLDYLRLRLANDGITLLEDQTPAYWQANLSLKQGGMQVARTDNAALSDFTVLVDTGEQQPFTFQGFRADADYQGRPLVVKTERKPLGTSRGDYSIKGMEGLCHIERKSCQDAISTVLGFGQHRDNFIKTLSFLAEIPSSCVIVECDRDSMLESCVSRGKKSVNEMRKTLNRQILAWEDDFRVPWVFNSNRRTAEYRAFLWLRRAYRHHFAAIKKAQKDS